MAFREISGDFSGDGQRIGLVVSRFNDFLTKQLLEGAIDCLVRHGVSDEQVTVAWVPGSNEAPLAVQRMAASGEYDALIVLGAVVQGATSHADLINSQVSRSLAKIAMDAGVPVINGIVTAQNLEQAIERSGTKAGNRGWKAGLAALEMVNLYKQI